MKPVPSSTFTARRAARQGCAFHLKARLTLLQPKHCGCLVEALARGIGLAVILASRLLLTAEAGAALSDLTQNGADPEIADEEPASTRYSSCHRSA